AVEVKNSTQVKNYHLTDAALQFWTMTKSGFKPDRFFLMHINKEYVKQGAITEELFQLTEITREVLNLQPFVSEKLKELHQLTLMESVPELLIGRLCTNPYGCYFQNYCWAHVPENSVFE